MKDIVLPEKAFPHKKHHVVLGHRFVNGRIRVSDEDAAKMTPQFVNFYSCTVEQVDEPAVEGADEDGDGALTVDTTKQTPAT